MEAPSLEVHKAAGQKAETESEEQSAISLAHRPAPDAPCAASELQPLAVFTPLLKGHPCWAPKAPLPYVRLFPRPLPALFLGLAPSLAPGPASGQVSAPAPELCSRMAPTPTPRRICSSRSSSPPWLASPQCRWRSLETHLGRKGWIRHFRNHGNRRAKLGRAPWGPRGEARSSHRPGGHWRFCLHWAPWYSPHRSPAFSWVEAWRVSG